MEIKYSVQSSRDAFLDSHGQVVKGSGLGMFKTQRKQVHEREL